MPELLRPSVVEKLKLCQEEIRKFADHRDDIVATRQMARVAVKSIAPEMQLWKGSKVEVATDSLWFTMNEQAGYGHEIKDDLFLLSGLFGGGTLHEEIEFYDTTSAFSEYHLCLKFAPQIRSNQNELVLAESVIVPVSSVGFIDKLN